MWESRRNTLAAYARRSVEAARRAGLTIRALENALKRLIGQQLGLENPATFQTKDESERALRAAVARDPEWQRAYGGAWDRIDALYDELPTMAPRLALSTLNVSRLGRYATMLVQYGTEVERPSDKRLEEFRDARLKALRFTLLSPAPIFPDMEEAVLAGWLEEARRTLGADDPFVQAALEDRDATDVAREAIANTQLADLDTRRALFEGGASAIRQSADPLLAVARRVDPVLRELRRWQDEHQRGVDRSAG